jgi:uncharacterized membrane protein
MKINPKFFLATILSLTLVNLDIIPLQTASESWVNIGTEAVAKSSGGRSGGGSFKGGSSRSRSNNRSSRSSSRNSSPSRSDSHNNRSSTTIYHGGTNSSYRGTSGTHSMVGLILLVLVLGIFGLVIFAVVYSSLKNMVAKPKGERVRDNDIVTISQLQVALSSLAKEVQADLSDLSLNTDTDTEEGLIELLRESALILLRNTQYWSHVLASSKSVNINQAEQAFNQLSIVERSKLSAESLTNINGKTKQKNIAVPDNESADYIVVTLILGTADDHPLFKQVRTTDELKSALEKLASIRSDYLLKLEVIWSPQNQADSLCYDEFISEYTEMLQLV